MNNIKFKNITPKNSVVQIVKSDKPNKKYKAIITNKKNVADFKLVYFGSLYNGDSKTSKRLYEHYKDITPFKLYKHLDHKDKKRREAYRKRHSKIMTTRKLVYKKNEDNNKYELKYIKIKPTPAYLVKYSPAYYSWNLLWS